MELPGESLRHIPWPGVSGFEQNPEYGHGRLVF